MSSPLLPPSSPDVLTDPSRAPFRAAQRVAALGESCERLDAPPEGEVIWREDGDQVRLTPDEWLVYLNCGKAGLYAKRLRGYESVDPAHQLVARTLEHDWDAALSSEQTLSDTDRRACPRDPERLTEADKAAVRRLAEDIPALWPAASTTAQDRQAVARLRLERVVIRVHGTSEHAEITGHWAGGTVTRPPLVRPVRRLSSWKRSPS